MHFNKLSLSLLSGALMAVSWPYSGSLTPLIFVALVPMLWMEEALYREKKNGLWVMVKYGYPGFLLFNALTTWWIFEVEGSFATRFAAAVPANLLNSLFMTIAFGLFHVTRMRIGNREGYAGLVIYWLAWEYLHLNWELSWPWLTFGNVFSIQPGWVQWYEITGILGGTLWILSVNFAVFNFSKKFTEKKLKPLRAAVILILLFAPLLIWSGSLRKKAQRLDSEGKRPEMEVVVVQPNTDPYKEKFDYGSASRRLDDMLELAAGAIGPETRLVIFPETALQEYTYVTRENGRLVFKGLWENDIEKSMSVKIIREFLSSRPGLVMVFGLSSDRLQDKDEPVTAASRLIKGLGVYYESYNAAMIISKDRPVVFYHKSELVPAVEFMPFEEILKPLAAVSLDFGGTSGTLGTQEDQVPFFFGPDSVGVATPICYESIYGHTSNEFVRNGADFLAIITNDGWWGDSPGYKQHLSYARLRAVETRRWVARAANTGISAFINTTGEVVQRSEWWVPAVLKQKIILNSGLTFYALYGDYLGSVAGFLAVLMVIYTFVWYIKRNEPFVKARRGR